MKIYIYIYTNIDENHLEKGFSYIGVSKDPEKRFYEHIKNNSLIGNKLRKHDFDFDILDAADSYEEAYELEQAYIVELNTQWPNGYNLNSGGQGGKICSDETIEKLRESHLGKKRGPMSAETIEKIRESHLGKPKSEEHKQKLRKPRSEETKAKMREAKLGKK